MSSSVILNGASFAIGTAAEARDQVRYDDHAWEPEDLVATVQFLATLDDRLPAYVLPVSESDIDFCHVRDELAIGEPASARPLAEPVFVADDVSHSDSDAMQDDASPAPPDVAAAEDNSSSAAQTPCSTEERSIIRTSNKPAHLKRVSFGSTKGSMVETLIYEKPAADEEHPAWRTKNNRNFVRSIVSATTADPLPEETTALLSSSEATRSASKVRVTYFESKRPLTLPSPEASDAEWDDTMAEPPPQHPTGYTRQISTESGQDNPFRPDGDLSREADELVELLKGGRPISEVLKSQEAGHQQQPQPEHDDGAEQAAEATESTPLASAVSRSPSAPSSPVKAGDATDAARTNNGSVGETDKKAEASSEPASSGVVEVQRIVAPGPAESQAEHVVIKKKSKSNCCVLQ